MIVAQPIEKGDVLADIGAFWRRGSKFIARLFQPQQHGPPVAHRQQSLHKGFGHAFFQRRLVGDHIQHQHNDADGNVVLLDDGVEGGPDAAAAGGSGAQRSVKQEWPVVIDRNQHVAFARRRQQLHINLPLCVMLQHTRRSGGDGRQRGGIPHHNVVNIGAAEQGIEEFRQRRAIF